MTSVVAAGAVGDWAGAALLAQPEAPREIPAMAAAIRLLVILIVDLEKVVLALRARVSFARIRRYIRATPVPVTVERDEAAGSRNDRSWGRLRSETIAPPSRKEDGSRSDFEHRDRRRLHLVSFLENPS
jgi:hypothetical protein